MDSEVEKFVKSCSSCLAVSPAHRPIPVTSTQLPKSPWEYVAVDFLGPLPSGQYILVVIDYFSRFMEVFFTRSTTSETTIKCLWQAFSRHGFPSRIKTDNATNLTSVIMEEFLATYGVAHITTPPLWPQANGEVERQNRSLLKRLQIAQLEKEDVEIALAKYLLAYNNTPHSSTGCCPAQLMFRRVLKDQLPSINHPSVQYEQAAERDAEKKFLQKSYADTKRRATPTNIALGDQVLVQAQRQNKLSPKFDPEPFVVVGHPSPTEVALRRGRSELRRSISAVKPVPSIECPAVSGESGVVSGQAEQTRCHIDAPESLVDTQTNTAVHVASQPTTKASQPGSPGNSSGILRSRFGREIRPIDRLNL